MYEGYGHIHRIKEKHSRLGPELEELQRLAPVILSFCVACQFYQYLDKRARIILIPHTSRSNTNSSATC